MIGKTLSHYKIIEKLGQGGQGEVYLAEDSRLDRKVALKILPQHLSERAELRERFEREARAVSSLNHPHICTLYDIGEQDGIHYLVMEHLVGETLEARLGKGPLPLEQTLEYAIQIADALDKAHRQGVVHRDLKPGNIMLVKSGAKLLDFGLAKLQAADTPTNLSALPTEQANLTAEGTILGTLQYMAPEQLEGKEADSRTDIFAFGAVVYEMATGKKAFEGKSQASLIAAIMGQNPRPMAELQPMTPALFDRVVRRCLAKEPDERWQTASDLMAELKWIAEPAAVSPIGQTMAGQPGRWRRTITFGLVALASAVIGVAVWSLLGSGDAVQPRASRVTIPVPEGYEMWNGLLPRLALSPDGRTLVYYTDGRLHVRSLDSFDAVPLAGTEEATTVSFSPDGDWITFSNPGGTGGLKKVALGGGPILTVLEGGGQNGADWGASGEIVYAPALGSSGLWLMSEEGGAARQITTVLDTALETAHRWPQLLPDGKSVLFTVIGPSGGWEDASIVVQDMAGGERRTVVEKGTYGRYVSTGHIIYAQANGTILAVPFDLGRQETSGTASSVASGVRVALFGGAASFAVSDGGTFAFVRGTNETQFLLNWMDRDGKVVRQLGPPLTGIGQSVSPDGSRIALTIRLPDHNDIWIADAASGERERFTFESTEDESPIWSPDGKRIAYSSAWTGHARRVYVKSVDGSSEPELLYTGEYHLHLSSWSPDGKWLAFNQAHPQTGADIWLVSADGEEQLVPVATTAAQERLAVFSPDGQWLVYNSDETGQPEVYAVSFPELGAKRQISQKGGQFAQWDAQGNELFYLGRNGEIIVVKMTAEGRSLRSGAPRVLFSDPDFTRGSLGVAPDGQHFAMLFANPGSPARDINVILNWFEELKRLAPTDN